MSMNPDPRNHTAVGQHRDADVARTASLAVNPGEIRDRPETPRDPDAGKYQTLTMLVVQVSLVLLGMNVSLPKGFTLDFVVALALLPLWCASVRDYVAARLITLLGLAAVVSGLVLNYASAADHVESTTNAVTAVVHLLAGVGTVGVLLWARTLIPLSRVAALYGAGAVLSALTSSASYTSLGWKYAFATPVAVTVLALVQRYRSALIAPTAAIVLGVVGVANEARSYFGFCVLTASLVFWQSRRRSVGRTPHRWAPALLMAGIATSIYYLTSALLTGGYLGVELQQRSVAQVDAAGSLIIGGRPEWTGTLQLMKLRPMGYGVGAVPDWVDVSAAERGLATVGLRPGNGYVRHYMFGGQFRLHSIVADLWVSFGWVGLALGVVVAATLIGALSRLIAERAAAPVVVFTTSLALWDLAFGPIYTNWPDVCLALGLILPLASSSRGRHLIQAVRSRGSTYAGDPRGGIQS